MDRDRLGECDNILQQPAAADGPAPQSPAVRKPTFLVFSQVKWCRFSTWSMQSEMTVNQRGSLNSAATVQGQIGVR
jgi:hypothetical protein